MSRASHGTLKASHLSTWASMARLEAGADAGLVENSRGVVHRRSFVRGQA